MNVELSFLVDGESYKAGPSIFNNLMSETMKLLGQHGEREDLVWRGEKRTGHNTIIWKR